MAIHSCGAYFHPSVMQPRVFPTLSPVEKIMSTEIFKAGHGDTLVGIAIEPHCLSVWPNTHVPWKTTALTVNESVIPASAVASELHALGEDDQRSLREERQLLNRGRWGRSDGV